MQASFSKSKDLHRIGQSCRNQECNSCIGDRDCDIWWWAFSWVSLFLFIIFFMILLMHVIISHKRGTVHHWHYYYFVKISSPKSFLNSLIFRSFLLVLWLELIFCKLTVDWHCFCSTCIFLFKRTKLFSHYIELIVSLPLGNWETWKNHLVEM